MCFQLLTFKTIQFLYLLKANPKNNEKTENKQALSPLPTLCAVAAAGGTHIYRIIKFHAGISIN
jgi:hypothetical protein